MLNIPNDNLRNDMIFRSIGNLYPFDNNKEWKKLLNDLDRQQNKLSINSRLESKANYYLYKKF